MTNKVTKKSKRKATAKAPAPRGAERDNFGDPIIGAEIRPGGIFLKLRPWVEWCWDDGEYDERQEVDLEKIVRPTEGLDDITDVGVFSAEELENALPAEPGTFSAAAERYLREFRGSRGVRKDSKRVLRQILRVLGRVRLADFRDEHLRWYGANADTLEEKGDIVMIKMLLDDEARANSRRRATDGAGGGV
jgi:hypothetical protein